MGASHEEMNGVVHKRINEIYSTEATMHNNMQEFVKDYRTISTDLFGHMSLLERAELEYLMLPYIKLVENGNPLENTLGDSATLNERIDFLIKQFNSPKFKDQSELLFLTASNHGSLIALNESIYNKESIKNDKKEYAIQFKDPGLRGGTLGEAKVLNSLTIQKAMATKNRDQTIQPTQRFMRYQILIGELEKSLKKLELPELQQISQLNAGLAKDLMDMNASLLPLSQEDLAANSAEEFSVLLAENYHTFAISHVKMTANLTKNDALDLKMDALSDELAEFSDPIDQFKIITKVYADAYLDDRKKGIKDLHFGTVKGPLLTELENSITKYLNLTPSANETQEELIFKNASELHDVRNELVKHLTTRAMAEGVLIGNEQIFTNAVKAIVRMGNNAINEWNRLTGKPIFKLNNTVVTVVYGEENTVNSVKESQIAVMFSKITPEIKQGLKVPYARDVLLGELKNTSGKNLDKDQMELLNSIISKLENVKSEPKEFHYLFVQAFTNVYINERKEKVDGALLQHMSDAALKFTQITGSEMFKEFSSKTKTDANILSSIDYNDSINNRKSEFVEKILSRALDALNKGQNKEHEAAAKAEFVNCIKVIVRIKAVGDWDSLISKYVNNDKSLLINANKDMRSKPIIGSQYGEPAIKKFFDAAVPKKGLKYTIDPHMVSDREARQWVSTVHNTSLLASKFGSSINTPSKLGIYSHSGSETSRVSDPASPPLTPKSPK